ncbi:COX assembly mitochondrial protein homolog [Leptopilina heterotoma]|uniref:COX assembly mitochondrial protein homolog n=1 Tax=Leptopilina heterotoma TaxID=63436 RepID=UPI001CA9D7DD|nr:COX assembly mitochondrial protein homolog [Leptopilina heterotoma]
MVDSQKESSQNAEKSQKPREKTVLRHSLSGGPHGLGDPDDKFLRKIESDVLIQEKIRYLSRKEKCADVSIEFGKCSKDAGLLMPWKCREENSKLQECLKYWFNNQEFRDYCTEQYLSERSEYRRTGIPPKKLDRKTKVWIDNPETQTQQ